MERSCSRDEESRKILDEGDRKKEHDCQVMCSHLHRRSTMQLSKLCTVQEEGCSYDPVT